jgi:hypothetical protein
MESNNSYAAASNPAGALTMIHPIADLVPDPVQHYLALCSRGDGSLMETKRGGRLCDRHGRVGGALARGRTPLAMANVVKL